MSVRIEPDPVLRVCSCLTARQALLPDIRSELAARFGKIALESPPFDFDTTDYYSSEMGKGIVRHWFCFATLCGAGSLPDMRDITGRIEQAFSVEGRRQVNLDPGYLDMSKLVLASLKEAPDKIYLREGVWAHACLCYKNGRFIAPRHSFDDFRDGRFDGFMMEARNLYKSLLRCRRTE